jgi:Protein of unknown function (DUF1194)
MSKMRKSLWIAALVAIMHAAQAIGFTATSSYKETACEVDTRLALYMDVSGSVSTERWTVQKRGYAAAIRSQDVIDAIQLGRNKSLELAVVQWSGSVEQKQAVGWTVVSTAASAYAFAERVEGMERLFPGSSTSISGAMEHALGQLNEARCQAVRQILDVSGDGSDDGGPALAAARENLLRRGVIINGLAIFGVQAEPDIQSYYWEKVVGGPASFVEPVYEPDALNAFGEAFKRKLIREIIAMR